MRRATDPISPKWIAVSADGAPGVRHIRCRIDMLESDAAYVVTPSTPRLIRRVTRWLTAFSNRKACLHRQDECERGYLSI